MFSARVNCAQAILFLFIVAIPDAFVCLQASNASASASVSDRLIPAVFPSTAPNYFTAAYA